MSRKVNDVSQSPEAPQFTLGATSEEAAIAAQITRNPLEGPGNIVDRLGYQFQIPRASVDSQISMDGHGLPNG